MSETTNTEQIEKEPTAEEIAAYRQNMHDYYDAELPLLRKQEDYENIRANIEEARARRMTMTLRMLHMTSKPPETPEEPKTTEPTGARKLKTD